MLLVAPATNEVGPRLLESRERVIGKRSPTKEDADLRSWARNKIWRPLCTSVSASENWAANVGIVRRNVVLPPPTRANGGMRELRDVPAPPEVPLFPKMLANNVTNVPASWAACNWEIMLVLRDISSLEGGGRIPRVRALLRSTSRISISRITSPRAFSD